MPPAPALLSIRAGVDQFLAIAWVVSLAVVSTGPPGRKGHDKRDGFVGPGGLRLSLGHSDRAEASEC
jgi:hypothetical protein